MEQLRKKIQKQVLAKISYSEAISDEELKKNIDEVVFDEDTCQGSSVWEKMQLQQEVFNCLRRYDVLQELVEDRTITEIMINGPDAIFIEEKGSESGTRPLRAKKNWRTLCNRLYPMPTVW